MMWTLRALMFALVLVVAAVATAETTELPTMEPDPTEAATVEVFELDLEAMDESQISTIPETERLFTDTQIGGVCGIPRPTPPLSCSCGGCCECYRCWNRGSLQKCHNSF